MLKNVAAPVRCVSGSLAVVPVSTSKRCPVRFRTWGLSVTVNCQEDDDLTRLHWHHWTPDLKYEYEHGDYCVCQSFVLSVAVYTHPTVAPQWTPCTVSDFLASLSSLESPDKCFIFSQNCELSVGLSILLQKKHYIVYVVIRGFMLVIITNLLCTCPQSLTRIFDTNADWNHNKSLITEMTLRNLESTLCYYNCWVCVIRDTWIVYTYENGMFSPRKTKC